MELYANCNGDGRFFFLDIFPNSILNFSYIITVNSFNHKDLKYLLNTSIGITKQYSLHYITFHFSRVWPNSRIFLCFNIFAQFKILIADH